MRIVIFTPNAHPATPLLVELGRSLRTFGAQVHFSNPDAVNPRERERCDGAIALDGVDFDRITVYRNERLRFDGTFEEYEDTNFAGADDTVLVRHTEGKLAIDDAHVYDMEAIKVGEMGRFLMIEKPTPKTKPPVVSAPEPQPIENDISGLPPGPVPALEGLPPPAPARRPAMRK